MRQNKKSGDSGAEAKKDAALFTFLKGPKWKKIYDAAPSGAKDKLALNFYWSTSKDDPGFSKGKYLEQRERVESKLTAQDLGYLIETADNELARKHYTDLLRKRIGIPETKVEYLRQSIYNPIGVDFKYVQFGGDGETEDFTIEMCYVPGLKYIRLTQFVAGEKTVQLAASEDDDDTLQDERTTDITLGDMVELQRLIMRCNLWSWVHYGRLVPKRQSPSFG